MHQAHSLLCFFFFWISNENIVNCLLVRHAMVHINIYIIAHLKRQTSDLHVTHQLLLSQHNLNWRGRISSLGKTIIRKFMSMIVEWNIRFQGIWICVCVLLLFFLLVFRFVCDFWIIYVIDKCYGASIFFFWSVPSFLWLLLCIIFLKWSFLWFTTWWWMLPSSNVHIMCAHFCIQVNWHLTEIIGNQWFWLRRRLLCCFLFLFSLCAHCDSNCNNNENCTAAKILEKNGTNHWIQSAVALGRHIKSNRNSTVECCIYCCCCRRFQGGSFSHDESQTLHSLIAHNIQFQVYYL